MKASFTTMPLVNSEENQFTLRELITGSAGSSKYYEAENDTALLMWIEMTVWGKRRCYPCLMQKPEGETLFFRIGSGPDNDESNRSFIACWVDTVSPETIEDYVIRELTENEFREKLKIRKNSTNN